MQFEIPGVVRLRGSKKLADLPAKGAGPDAPKPAEKIQARSAEVNAHLYAARDARRAKRWADAIKSYEEAIKLAPEDSKLLDNTAWFLLTVEDEAHRDHKRAAELATRAVRLTDESSGQFLGTLAEALHQCGDLEGAARRAEVAAKLDPHPERRATAERFRKEFDEQLDKGLDKRLCQPPEPETAESVKKESVIPDWPPRAVKPDEPVAADPAGMPPATEGTDDTDGGTPPWALLGIALAGLICAVGMTLALRRALRALR